MGFLLVGVGVLCEQKRELGMQRKMSEKQKDDE